MASQPILTPLKGPHEERGQEQGEYLIRIMGDVVGLSYLDPAISGWLQLWSWHSGTPLLVRHIFLIFPAPTAHLIWLY